MRISLISTVLNEDKNIDFFIKSIIKQKKRPEEFIIVDGGSTDKTYQILKEFSKKNKWIKIFQKKSFNISQGRNYAIKKTKNDVIVTCDTGGKYREDWLEKLTKGFNGQVSFGTDKPLIKNEFQKVLAKKVLHKKVVGSSRNMIFLKKIWKEVGGYPEDMVIGEDTLFDERIRKKGYKMIKIPNAICEWEMRDDLKSVKRQYYRYGYWDGVAYRRHKIIPLKSKLAIFILSILFPLYPFLIIVSEFSLDLKIDVIRRFAYLKGFYKGLLNMKEN